MKQIRPHGINTNVDLETFQRIEKLAIEKRDSMAAIARELILKGLEVADPMYGMHFRYDLANLHWFAGKEYEDKPIIYFQGWIRRRGFEAKVIDNILYTELAPEDLAKIIHPKRAWHWLN